MAKNKKGATFMCAAPDNFNTKYLLNHFIHFKKLQWCIIH